MKLRAELTVLPPREQARRLAAIAAVLVAQIERTEPDAPETKAALAAIRTWGDGGRLTGGTSPTSSTATMSTGRSAGSPRPWESPAKTAGTR